MINLRVPVDEANLQPRITVIGVGGAGGNAVNNMIKSNLEGVEFLVCNTDAQALKGSSADRRLQLGLNITKGLGAGASPDKGRAAAEEAIEEIISYLEGSNMAFITAGMGGGTGTGAGPVIARAAREMDILTVGVVTKPFHFEGAHRMRLADEGIRELQQYVDTLIVIPNQNLFRIANQKTSFAEAFKMADDVLYSGVRGVTDLMVLPGLINLDFADIRAVMAEMGKAMMGTGEGEGDKRAIDAAQAAISNPLLDEVSLKGARAMLINITGGADISLFEVDEAVNHVREQVDPDANVIFGSTFDASMEGRMRVSVVATGIDAIQMREPQRGSGGGIIMTERRRPVVSINEGRAGVAANAAPQRFAQPVGQAGGLAATARKLEPEYEEPETTMAPQVEAEFENAPVAQSEVAESESEQAPATLSEAAPVFAPPLPAKPAMSAGTIRPQVSQEPRASHAPAAPEARRPSLIERMIGQRQGSSAEEERPRAPAPRAAAPAPASRPAAAKPPVAAPAPAPAPKSQVSVQANLGVDSTGSRASTQKADDDTLDIPAFLRRQAN